MAAIMANNNQNLKFTKTETEYNMKSVRFLLLTITTLFIIIAGLMIVLGNSVYAHYHNYAFFYDGAKVGRFTTPSELCVFLGLFLMLISLFGFFGSLKQSTCMVNVYALILILVFIMKLVIVVLSFTMNADTIMEYVEVPVWSYSDPEIRAEIDYMQASLGCCGSSSYTDYMGMDLPNDTSVVISSQIDGDLVTMEIPASCCVSVLDGFCTKMWSSGCMRALVSLVAQNAIVIGVLGVSVMFINLLGIIFAVLLARCIRKLKSERAYMSWKIKEQIILARQEQKIESSQNDNQVYIPHNDSSVA